MLKLLAQAKAALQIFSQRAETMAAEPDGARQGRVIAPALFHGVRRILRKLRRARRVLGRDHKTLAPVIRLCEINVQERFGEIAFFKPLLQSLKPDRVRVQNRAAGRKFAIKREMENLFQGRPASPDLAAAAHFKDIFLF